MKKTTIIFILAIFLVPVKGQDTGFSLTGGIGTYDLGMLKSYHETLIPRLPVDAKGFNYFPPFTSIRLNLFRQHTEKLKYGLVYAFSTTGAHANYSDYSGYVNLDQIVSAYQFGLTASYRLMNLEFISNRLDVSAYGDLRLGYVRDEVAMSINTNYYYETNRLVLKTVSPMAEAGLDIMFHLKKISLGVEGGMLYDTGAKFRTGNESYPASVVSLDPSSSDEIRSGMSGLRGGIKMIFWINKGVIPE